MQSPRAAFWAGVRAELPLLVGVAPFGMIYGVLAIESGLSPLVALAMSSVIFAGSSQFLAVQLLAQSVSALVMIATIAVVNLRHALYSASLAPHIAPLPQRWRWLLAYLLTDEAYAVVIVNYERPGDAGHRHWFFLVQDQATCSGMVR